VADAQAADGLVTFLDQIALTPGIDKVHLIAHGAGNQLLSSALVRSAADTQGRLRAKLREVVLLNPAVPLDPFKDELDALAKSAPASMRLTLYAAPVDRSLWDAWQAGGPTSLAGEASIGVPLLHRGVQTLDLAKSSMPGVSQLNGDRLVMNPVISQDLRALLQPGAVRPPERRNPLFRLVRPADGSPAWWAYDPKPAARK
jgi:esterase/lipase superfamily enzyme